jgi:hypothetical protein
MVEYAKHYDLAIKVLQTLHLYVNFYGSGEPTLREFEQIVAMLRHEANNAKHESNEQAGMFLNGLADLLVAERNLQPLQPYKI